VDRGITTTDDELAAALTASVNAVHTCHLWCVTSSVLSFTPMFLLLYDITYHASVCIRPHSCRLPSVKLVSQAVQLSV